MKVFILQEKQGFLVPIHLIQQTNKGQSLAEFILTFGIVCMIVLVFVKLSFNFTKGYMIHYANYMASRSFLVQDNNSASPEGTDGNASTFAYNNVYQKIMSNIKQNEITFLRPGNVDNKLFVGLKTTVEEAFSLAQFIGGKEKIKLISESFLGREPVISECAQGVCAAIKEITGESCGQGTEKGFVTLWDNGC